MSSSLKPILMFFLVCIINHLKIIGHGHNINYMSDSTLSKSG